MYRRFKQAGIISQLLQMGIDKTEIFVYFSFNALLLGFTTDYLAELATIMRE
jgi:hypothetical protein